MTSRLKTGIAAALILAAAGLGSSALAFDKAAAPVPAGTVALMSARNMAPSAPILMRVYKKEAVLEVWKQTREGRYALLKSFPICRWSGQLGPKHRAGDRQAPEGFYSIARRQLNPNSAYYLSFDTGFPNAYDRANGATGSALMVHGTCSSAGCYAMTDTQIAEIFALARDALAGGQTAFQFQAYPFRMTAVNMARHRLDHNIAFWRELKEGSDRFEATGEEPIVNVVAAHYAFSSSSPQKEAVAAAHHAAEEVRIAALVANGSAAIRTTYADGGQNAIFAALTQKGENLGDISRPEALAYAGREVVLAPERRPRLAPVLPASLPIADSPAPAPVREPQPASQGALSTFALLQGSSPILPAAFAPRI